MEGIGLMGQFGPKLGMKMLDWFIINQWWWNIYSTWDVAGGGVGIGEIGHVM